MTKTIEQYLKDGEIAELFLTARERVEKDNYLRKAKELEKIILGKTGAVDPTPEEDDWITVEAARQEPSGWAALEKFCSLLGRE